MELYQTENKIEEWLELKAALDNTPLGGAFELLPNCNMNCRMCYIHDSGTTKPLLTCDQWLEIARSALSAGTLFVLLTGGEPLLFPEFGRLYTGLSKMGFLLTLNTNGTLLNEKWADLLTAYPPKRVNITLYGSCNETYRTLCGNPRGFTQVMNAVQLLKERDIPIRFNGVAVPENVHDLETIIDVARSLDIPQAFTYYMFPPVRRSDGAEAYRRFTPEEAAEISVRCQLYQHPEADPKEEARKFFEKMNQPKPVLYRAKSPFRCRAATTGFWLNWKGELTPCGLISEGNTSVVGRDFREAWHEVTQKLGHEKPCQQCRECKYSNICIVCAAKNYAETGATEGVPEYVCRMTEATVAIMEKILHGDASAGGSLDSYHETV